MARSLLHRSLSRGKKTLIAIAAFAFLFVILNYIVMPAYVNHSSRLQVPAVEGMTLDSAGQVLRAASLDVVHAGVRLDPTRPPGSVIMQNPPAGAIVKEGRRIYLTVSGGDVTVKVPQLRGKSLRDGKFSIERHWLRVGDVAYATSDEFPENTIISQTPPADSDVARGTAVSFVVSQGPARGATTVPLLEGKSLQEAEQLLAQAGLRVGNVTQQPSADLLPNTVVEQYPAAGEPATEGQAVDLFVAQSSRPVEEIPKPRP